MITGPRRDVTLRHTAMPACQDATLTTSLPRWGGGEHGHYAAADIDITRYICHAIEMIKAVTPMVLLVIAGITAMLVCH